ncbi:MAG: hypothetical protein Tsb0013_00290 [Phycisphaerales bacterium]
MQGLLARWKRLSRAVQWSILALIGLGIFYAVVDPVTRWANDMNVIANDNAEKLARLQEQASKRSEATGVLRRNARVFGDVLPPGPLDERVQTASQRIDAILRGNNAGDLDFSTRSPVALGTRVLPGYVENPDNFELQRVTFDVSFTGTPETVVDILAQLERIPEITLIADLNLKRIDSRGARLVQADLAPEVWGIARKGGR